MQSHTREVWPELGLKELKLSIATDGVVVNDQEYERPIVEGWVALGLETSRMNGTIGSKKFASMH